jgi:hypothetical protein
VLFHTTWESTDTSEAAIQRNLDFFSQWKPPDGFEFKASGDTQTALEALRLSSQTAQRRSPGRLPLYAVVTIHDHPDPSG